MRWFYLALILSLTSAGGAWSWLEMERKELKKLCQTLPLGATISEVRKSARARGFEPKMDPFAQMRIEPSFWHSSPPSCRVFFNRARTVEYRLLQSS